MAWHRMHQAFAVARLATLALVIPVILASCGFQLRGADLRSSVTTVYLTAAPHHSFELPMRQALKRAGVEFVDPPAADTLIVDLLDERSGRRSISVSESAVAAEYEVILAVHFGVRDAAGNALVEPQWLERDRVYRVDRDNILGSAEERALLEREMQSELIQQIIRSLEGLAGAANGD